MKSVIAALFLLSLTACGDTAKPVAMPLPKLRAHNVDLDVVMYKGRESVRVKSNSTTGINDGARFAIIPDVTFENGTIDVDLAGDALPGLDATFRGFTGLAFRADPEGKNYECFYLRPLNGRSPDQLQRNHSTQYISYPEFPWQRLRQETPGKYESYVDLVPGEWTHVRIVVDGAKAQLYVNRAGQPALIVDDLKHGESRGVSHGSIALWVGPGVVAHFANLSVAAR